MNPDAPPRKKIAPRSGRDGARRKPDGRDSIATRQPPQLQTLVRWYDEAQRLACEYHRTGASEHLRAFCRMIVGVMQEIEKAFP